MADSKDGSLEHIVRPESKEVFKKMMVAYHKDTGSF